LRTLSGGIAFAQMEHIQKTMMKLVKTICNVKMH